MVDIVLLQLTPYCELTELDQLEAATKNSKYIYINNGTAQSSTLPQYYLIFKKNIPEVGKYAISLSLKDYPSGYG